SSLVSTLQGVRSITSLSARHPKGWTPNVLTSSSTIRQINDHQQSQLKTKTKPQPKTKQTNSYEPKANPQPPNHPQNENQTQTHPILHPRRFRPARAHRDRLLLLGSAHVPPCP